MFLRFPEIAGFDDFAARARGRCGAGADRTVRVRGKVRLRGEPVGLAIRREGEAVLSTAFDPSGRGRGRGLTAAERLLSGQEGGIAALTTRQGSTFVYGTWAGPGVGDDRDAVSRIPHPFWFPFAAAHVRSADLRELSCRMNAAAPGRDPADLVRVVTDPEAIAAMLPACARIRVMPWAGPPLDIDPSDERDVSGAFGCVDAETRAVGIADPFVMAEFGIRGGGEGMMFLPESPGFDDGVTLADLTRLSFARRAEEPEAAPKGPLPPLMKMVSPDKD
ncbi:MAG: hypothetical protein DI629_20945 [Mesorhizobium amorphae]|nr:MAG: hypothetical protein DI629_20945 [Mesorhizobium amorphae]